MSCWLPTEKKKRRPLPLSVSVPLPGYRHLALLSGMGIVCENANFRGSETDSMEENTVRWEKKLELQKRKEKRKHQPIPNKPCGFCGC